ncbi:MULTISPECIES: methyltransferase domain-containing protein [unclassified Bradyrhizobium]|uniref:methyltransferase domain-containing protein n=1 Tax=unclassified Bradyrhizobium TaxID=2631580 RepID=UPI002915DE78|nr:MULTISPECIES: methyltransferase domain-containing protein [unclassified Bradyrhizobium]
MSHDAIAGLFAAAARRLGVNESFDAALDFVGLVHAAQSVMTAAGPRATDGPVIGLIGDLIAYLASGCLLLEQAWVRAPKPSEPSKPWRYTTSADRGAIEELIIDVLAHAEGLESRVDPAIDRLLADLEASVVFDFGCGAGRFAVEAARRGRKVYWTESNSIKATFMRYRASRHRLEERMTEGFPPPGLLVDGVLALNVLDHVDDPTTATERLLKLLKPDGWLAVWATFVDDGQHRGGPSIRRSVFETLAQYCRIEHHPETVDKPLEIFRVGRDEIALTPRTAFGGAGRGPIRVLRPIRAYGLALIADPKGPGRIAIAPKFQVEAMSLNEDAAWLIEQCNGAKTVEAIVEDPTAAGLERAEVEDFLRFLWSNHVIAMAVD